MTLTAFGKMFLRFVKISCLSTWWMDWSRSVVAERDVVRRFRPGAALCPLEVEGRKGTEGLTASEVADAQQARRPGAEVALGLDPARNRGIGRSLRRSHSPSRSSPSTSPQARATSACASAR